MKPTLTVNHQLGSYPIFIGDGLLQRVGELLGDRLNAGSKHVVVSDQSVFEIYGAGFVETLSGHQVHWHICPDGEKTKSFDRFQLILKELLASGIDRKSTVIALGGGVPGDLAGFVAATYMRGIDFVQVPTSLLAQVDSSVGGKTGINLPLAKNSVGAFWQPQCVMIDPSVLRTLDPTEFASGLAEVVKYGVIMDKEFFEFLESNVKAINNLEMPVLESMIRRCCELKARVVEEDEREISGRRVILNYGHTFGHAIETVFGYGAILHGHAVGMGMHAAAHLALLLNRVDEPFVRRQKKLLDELSIPWCFPTVRQEDIEIAMKRDKKTAAGNLNFVLPTRIGHVELVSCIDRSKVIEAMDRACQDME